MLGFGHCALIFGERIIVVPMSSRFLNAVFIIGAYPMVVFKVNKSDVAHLVQEFELYSHLTFFTRVPLTGNLCRIITVEKSSFNCSLDVCVRILLCDKGFRIISGRDILRVIFLPLKSVYLPYNFNIKLVIPVCLKFISRHITIPDLESVVIVDFMRESSSLKPFLL